jgi:hypothetical protein
MVRVVRRGRGLWLELVLEAQERHGREDEKRDDLLEDRVTRGEQQQAAGESTEAGRDGEPRQSVPLRLEVFALRVGATEVAGA